MEDTLIVIVVVIIVVILLLLLALAVTGYALSAALIIFAFAATQGFIGIAVYFAAWVFLFPVMLIATLIIAIVIAYADIFSASERKVNNRKFSIKRKSERRGPPKGSDEKYKWANRLPPYDK